MSKIFSLFCGSEDGRLCKPISPDCANYLSSNTGGIHIFTEKGLIGLESGPTNFPVISDLRSKPINYVVI